MRRPTSTCWRSRTTICPGCRRRIGGWRPSSWRCGSGRDPLQRLLGEAGSAAVLGGQLVSWGPGGIIHYRSPSTGAITAKLQTTGNLQLLNTAKAVVFSTNTTGKDLHDPNGKDDYVAINQLHFPINKNVLVRLSSMDVIHSFFVPEFRVKQDVVPGMAPPQPVMAMELKPDNSCMACGSLPMPKIDKPSELLVELGYSDPNGEQQTVSTRLSLWPAKVVTFDVREPAQAHHFPVILSPFGYSLYRAGVAGFADPS